MLMPGVQVMPTLRQCAEDKSWRVRYMVADKFTELQVLRLVMCNVNMTSIIKFLFLYHVMTCAGGRGQGHHQDGPGARIPVPAEGL